MVPIDPQDLPLISDRVRPALEQLAARDPTTATEVEIYASLLLGNRLLWSVDGGTAWLITQRMRGYVLIWGLVGKDLERTYPAMLQEIRAYATSLGTPVLRAWARDGLVPFLARRRWKRVFNVMEIEL